MANEKQFIALESSGIYRGIVMEDLAVTMKRTGKRFAKIFCPELWADKDGAYPYTYIEGFNELPNLIEGMEVYVSFEQGCQLYPIIKKNMNDMPNESYETLSYPNNSSVNFPSTNDERMYYANTIDDCVIQKTTNFFTVKNANTIITMHKTDGIIIYCSGNNSKIQLECNKTTLTLQDGGFSIRDSNGNNITSSKDNGISINGHLKVFQNNKVLNKGV